MVASQAMTHGLCIALAWLPSHCSERFAALSPVVSTLFSSTVFTMRCCVVVNYGLLTQTLASYGILSIGAAVDETAVVLSPRRYLQERV